MAISANNIDLGVIRPNQVHNFVLPVFNSGDKTAEFSVSIAHHTDQQEYQTLPSWVTFSPRIFVLEPREWMQVNVEVKVKRGKDIKNGAYFCFVQACHRGCAGIKLRFVLNKE